MLLNGQFSGQILCERVRYHVLGGTVNKDNFASCNAIMEPMDTKVCVLWAFTVPRSERDFQT